MKNSSKLEIIAVISLFIGVVSWLSQKFFYIETLKNAYGLGDFLLIMGMLLTSLNLWKKEKAEKKKTIK